MWLQTDEARRVTAQPGAWTTVAVDASTIVMRHDRGAMLAQLFVIDTDSGEVSPLTPDDVDSTLAVRSGSGWFTLEDYGPGRAVVLRAAPVVRMMFGGRMTEPAVSQDVATVSVHNR